MAFIKGCKSRKSNKKWVYSSLTTEPDNEFFLTTALCWKAGSKPQAAHTHVGAALIYSLFETNNPVRNRSPTIRLMPPTWPSRLHHCMRPAAISNSIEPALGLEERSPWGLALLMAQHFQPARSGYAVMTSKTRERAAAPGGTTPHMESHSEASSETFPSWFKSKWWNNV